MKTKIIAFCIIAIIIVCGCTKQQSNINSKNNKPSWVEDNLKKNTDSIDVVLVDDNSFSTLYIGKTNNKSFAAYVMQDSMLIFYQKPDNKKWVATDTLDYKMPFSFAKCTDLNADKYNDVIISSLIGSAGNADNTVFLYDRKTGLFKHNYYYDLTNIKYHKKGNFISASWFGGVVHCQDKHRYVITGDSLTLIESVTFCPDSIGKTGTITFFKLKNNIKTVTKSQSGEASIIWGVFENAYWNSAHDL